MEEVEIVSNGVKKERKCRYFNFGHCKYKEKCRFVHPQNVCNVYLEGICEGSSCPKRHPKACNWFGGERGCTRNEACDYSHDTLAFDGQNKNAHKNESKTYACLSCKSEWKESNCVVQHIIQEKELNFCLNCEDWVKNKQNIPNEGWSLFDQDGKLNEFV